MPIRKKDYPDNWKELSQQVRSEAGQRCEWCGAPNHQVIRRRKETWKARYEGRKEAYLIDWERVEVIRETTGEDVHTSQLDWPRLKFHGLTKIILTTAHLDRNTKNNDRDNLAALCQRCHLSHDILQHVSNRKYGRYHTKEHQMKLKFK